MWLLKQPPLGFKSWSPKARGETALLDRACAAVVRRPSPGKTSIFLVYWNVESWYLYGCWYDCFCNSYCGIHSIVRQLNKNSFSNVSALKMLILYMGGTEKKKELLYKKFYIYFYRFKLQPLSKHSPFDAIHLSKLFLLLKTVFELVNFDAF